MEYENQISGKAKAGLCAALLAATLGLGGIIASANIVPAGQVGVVNRFEEVRDKELPSGFHFIDPLANVVKINTQTKEKMEPMSVQTNEGLMASLDVSILYRVNPDEASVLYERVGENYEEVVIVPMLRNVSRDVIAGHSSEDLYNPSRTDIATEIFAILKPSYEARGIELEEVLLRNVALPALVTNAIETKIEAKQQAETMEYVLQKEKLITQQRQEEARGIAAISSGITPEYLQLKYIQNLETLAKSNNNTFVVTPYGQDLTPRMPLELNNPGR